MDDWARHVASTERDERVRRARQLRNGIVATGVVGSLGLTGVAAAATIGARQSSGGSATNVSHSRQSGGQGSASGGTSVRRQQRGDDGAESGEGGDDGGHAAQRPRVRQSQPRFQQPKAPSPGNTAAAPQGTSSSS